MYRKAIAFVLFAALAFSLAGCGSARPAETDAPAPEPQPASDTQLSAAENDGQNPVLSFVGVYHLEDSVEALVEAEGAEDAKFTVTYAGSPWFHHRTVMSGRFDPETLTVEFANAVMTEYTYRSDGSVDEEKVSYENGSGRAVFDPENNTLTITEEFPSGASATVYAWGAAPDMKTVTDPDHYASVTAMDKAKVETVVGFAVRTAYLSENWYALADMIRYPITINGTELADVDAFLGYMMDKTVAESDREAMLDEDFLDMFVNSEGIMMGDGEIWLSDPNYGTDREPLLQIIAINGIVGGDGNEASADEPATGSGRQDGERFETVILLEGMEETVRYEHIRNDALGIEMDYDYESLVRYSGADFERFVSIYDDPDDPENYLEVTYSAEPAEAAAASIREDLAGTYEVTQDELTLDHAGRCLRIEASGAADGGTPSLQTVYIVPADDGCRVAAAHCTLESAEGFGRRFSYLVNTLSLLEA